MPASPLMPATHEFHLQGNALCLGSLPCDQICWQCLLHLEPSVHRVLAYAEMQCCLLLQILNGDFLPTDNLYFKGMTLARCFRVLDSIVLAILIYLGALAFKRVVASEKNQLAYCIQVTSFL